VLIQEEKSLNIIINEDNCIGCGVCVAMNEDVFILDEESGIAKILSENNNEMLLKEIIDTCPVNAISLAR
jgi:ferredoxin